VILGLLVSTGHKIVIRQLFLHDNLHNSISDTLQEYTHYIKALVGKTAQPVAKKPINLVTAIQPTIIPILSHHVLIRIWGNSVSNQQLFGMIPSELDEIFTHRFSSW